MKIKKQPMIFVFISLNLTMICSEKYVDRPMAYEISDSKNSLEQEAKEWVEKNNINELSVFEKRVLIGAIKCKSLVYQGKELPNDIANKVTNMDALLSRYFKGKNLIEAIKGLDFSNSNFINILIDLVIVRLT